MGRTAVEWIVQCDPSGTFTAGRFTLTTIRQSARDGVWPEGIIFQHQTSTQKLRYVQGELQGLTAVRSGQAHHA